MTAIVAFLHVSRSESFRLRKVHLIQSSWIEIPTTFGKGKGTRARALEVLAVDGQNALRIVDRDLERAQAFVDRHAPGAEIEVWRSPDGSQLHAPELADLAPYSLGLFIALVPVAMLSEGLGQIIAGLEAMAFLLLQASQADVLQLARQLRDERAERLGIVLLDRFL